jgi:hydroxyacylglutathione hydrolase
MTLEIIRIPVLSDNYIWLVHEAQSGETMVVDPAVADVPLAEAEKRGWKITQIWNTHWHPDHTGGNAEIKAVTGCIITGPAAEAERIPSLDIKVREGDIVRLGKVEAKVIDVPAHTAGHIAFYLPSEHAAFVGDTLFAMGCGRLFEGTAAQMYSNMRKLEALPDETAVYCAHEYTQSNGRFALTVEPGNAALVARMNDVDAMRMRGEPTVPTSIGAEKATNPFMRAASIEELATRRTAKDQG